MGIYNLKIIKLFKQLILLQINIIFLKIVISMKLKKIKNSKKLIKIRFLLNLGNLFL